MKKIVKNLVLLFAAFALLMQIPIPSHAAQAFTDVSANEWFAADVTKLSELGIIKGYPDGSFRPNSNLTRGEFIKMVAMVAEIWSDKKPTGKHWAESEWNALNDAGILDVSFYGGTDSGGNVKEYTEPLFKLTAKELDTNISRYEMAYILNGVLYSAFYEKQMELKTADDSYANYIGDYNQLVKAYQGPVEQVFSKGILTGYPPNSEFIGGNALSRAEAASVIVRLAWSNQRKAQSFATEKQVPTVAPGSSSFALQYRNLSNAERRQMLFGNPNKTYFTSATDAKDYMVSIQVPIWKLNSNGAKVKSSAWLTVHKLVANEVKTIFNEIYNDPERFPMNGVGGARYSDTMRHSWGCAIDINPNENYYINYKTGQTVGSFCYKNGSSPYCITPNSSVVRAFARQGWGWGGQGWTSAADYMHFSILSSGG